MSDTPEPIVPEIVGEAESIRIDDESMNQLLQLALSRYLILIIGAGIVSTDPTKEEIIQAVSEQIAKLWAEYKGETSHAEIIS